MNSRLKNANEAAFSNFSGVGVDGQNPADNRLGQKLVLAIIILL